MDKDGAVEGKSVHRDRVRMGRPLKRNKNEQTEVDRKSGVESEGKVGRDR